MQRQRFGNRLGKHTKRVDAWMPRMIAPWQHLHQTRLTLAPGYESVGRQYRPRRRLERRITPKHRPQQTLLKAVYVVSMQFCKLYPFRPVSVAWKQDGVRVRALCSHSLLLCTRSTHTKRIKTVRLHICLKNPAPLSCLLCHSQLEGKGGLNEETPCIRNVPVTSRRASR